MAEASERVRRRFAMGLIMALLLGSACDRQSGYKPRDGDLVFQSSQSSQSLAIQKATGSKYSHMGIVYLGEDGPFVFEAVGPVKSTPLRKWIARGTEGHFVVKRLRDVESRLDAQALAAMKAVGESMDGRPYDRYFEWSDERIYCSELVWKIYQRALGLVIGEPRPLGSFDLEHPLVKDKLRERFGDEVPLDEPVISPAAMFASDLLVTVHEHP